MTKLADILHFYLGTGLKIMVDNHETKLFSLGSEMANVGLPRFPGSHDVPISEIKPILYDKSFLTDEYLKEMDLDPLDYMIMSDYVRGDMRNCDLPFDLFNELLKRHFNVFELSSDQYIDKSTL